MKRIPEQKIHAEKSFDEPKPEIESTKEVPEITPQRIEEIKLILLDPHTISQKHDMEGHLNAEVKISNAETKVREVDKSIRNKKEGLKQQKQSLKELDTLKVEKNLKLKRQLETITARLKKLFRLKDRTTAEIQAEIGLIETEMDNLTMEASQLNRETKRLALEQAELPDPEKMLEAYYEKMEAMPLSNEEKRELLKPEVLAELSTEEYIALWRRLNPHFLSHVTRQGFRDHNAMVYHSGGLQEFHDGLKKTLGDEKLLRSPLGIEKLRSRDESSIRNFLESWVLEAEDKDEAKKRLNVELHYSMATAPKYPDKTAVHFANQLVADSYYGGEKNNEVFFLFPSDVIASQYDFAFNGSKKDFTQPQSETKWNDVFVWPTSLEKPGLPIDSGMVFLPEDTMVDKDTGSKYASEIKLIEGEEKRVMIEDEELTKSFVRWAVALDKNSPAIQAYQEYDANRNERREIQEDRGKKLTAVFRQEIMELGFCEDAADNLVSKIFQNNNLTAWKNSGKIGWGGGTPEEAALEKIKESTANLKRADKPVTSKEYWIQYFEENPEQKPKHMIFFSGDPTTAIYEFQREHNIGQADVSKKEGILLGFDDHHVTKMEEDPRSKRGLSELMEIANRMIEEHFDKK